MLNRSVWLVAASACLAFVGCASKPSANAPAPATGQLNAGQAATVLSQRAAKEAAETSRGDRRFLHDAPFPPGVDPATLRRAESTNQRAHQTLEAALTELAAAGPGDGEPMTTPQQPADPEQQAQALKHYSRGRNAALENRHTQAIFELQRALAIDPGSPQILRELARSYMASGNNARAADLFEQISQLNPEDSEAAFVVALNAANRREFSRAAAVLARFRLAGNQFTHDSAADVVADFALATCLRELGFDLAFIQASQSPLNLPDELDLNTANAARLASVYRQRGDTWRAVGDAHCRLGEYERALAAYAQAEALKVSDPTTLRPRIVYANLCLGRPLAAQREMLRFLEYPDPPLTDRDIRLCAYLREYAAPVDALAQAVRELYQRRTDDSALVRAAASLLTADQATSLLREFVGRRPRDLDGVRQLLQWLSQQDVNSAAALTVALTGDHPDLASEYTEQLMIAVPRLSDAVRAVRTTPQSTGRVQLEVRLLAKSAALGMAWDVCRSANEQSPGDRNLILLQIELAASLQDRVLFDEALGRSARIDDATGLATISRAYRTLGDIDGAKRMARRALEVDPQNSDALIALAWAHAAQALEAVPTETSSDSAAVDLSEAADTAELAIAADPTRDEPYALLAAIYGPRSSQADTRRYRELMHRLRQANPASPQHVRLEAMEAVSQRRYDVAVEKLINLCEANPVDGESLRRLITAWESWGRLDAAQQWLDERLVQRPFDSLLLEQWMRVTLLQRNIDLVIGRLEQAMLSDPEDYAVRHLLEQVYRAAAKPHLALELAEQRLLDRPQSVRRELELAVMYGEADLPHQALARLDWIREHAADATLDELSAALVVAGRIHGQPERRDALTLGLAEVATERYPDSPLQVYGSGLRALARQEKLDDSFDRLAQLAANQARGAAGPTIQSAALWQELAQGLVDDGHPAAAARALRVRLQSASELEPQARGLLARVILVAEAAAAIEAQSDEQRVEYVEQSLNLLRQLALRDELTFIFGSPEDLSLDEAVYELSSIHTLLGSEIGAQRLLEESLALQPHRPMAMNNLGYARIEKGVSDERTIQWIEQAHAIMPHDPNILDTIGWLRYKQGRFSDETPADAAGDAGNVTPGALSLIRRAQTRGDRPSPEVLDHLGDVEWRLGNRDASSNAWRQALAYLDDSTFQQREVQLYLDHQSRRWNLVVADARQLYDLHYGAVQQRVREKLEAMERGEEPSVAPTFAELAAPNP